MFEEIDKLLNANKKIYLLGCALQYFESTLSNNINCEVETEQNKWNGIVKNPKIHFLSWSDWNKMSVENILA